LDALVAHYHEIGLKGRNREYFEEALARNIRRALRGTGYARLKRGFGRILVQFHDDALLEAAGERVARVFGVAYLGVGRQVRPELEAIGGAALELMRAEPFESFAIRARRSYSTLATSSQQINIAVGRLVQEATGRPVDLTTPAATAWIELFGSDGIVYRKRLRGPGGLPAGVSGRMLALLSGGIDSPVAAWRMGLRGAEVELVHFHGQPFTDPSSVRQAEDIARVLARWHLKCVLHIVPLADAQREIVMNAPPNLRVVLYRRTMMRIAAQLATERKAAAVVTGDSLGQVASQTIDNIKTVDAAVPGLEVLRPLIGMDKQEIVLAAQKIGTYSVSTRRYQDCCVLFQPRSPATSAKPHQAAAAESDIDLDALVGKSLAGIEMRELELEAVS
jgi:thiamine biosynthesis protein ThiI